MALEKPHELACGNCGTKTIYLTDERCPLCLQHRIQFGRDRAVERKIVPMHEERRPMSPPAPPPRPGAAPQPALDPSEALRFALAQFKYHLERADRLEGENRSLGTTVADLTDKVKELEALLHGEKERHALAKDRVAALEKELTERPKAPPPPVLADDVTKEFDALFGGGQRG